MEVLSEKQLRIEQNRIEKNSYLFVIHVEQNYGCSTPTVQE